MKIRLDVAVKMSVNVASCLAVLAWFILHLIS